MESILDLKLEGEESNEAVEYQIMPLEKHELYSGETKIDFIEQRIFELGSVIYNNDDEMDKLTNKADSIDYAIAVFSGLISGAIDSFFVGEFSIEDGTEWSKEKTEKFISKFSDLQGKDNIISSGNKFKPAENDEDAADAEEYRQQIANDFSHNTTIIGLVFSLLTQFTGKTFGTDESGNIKMVPVSRGDKVRIGKNLKQKILFGTVYWLLHVIKNIDKSQPSGNSGVKFPKIIFDFFKKLSSLSFLRI